MKLIEKLKRNLAAVGATLDENPYSLHCDAPRGYVWKANHIGTLTIHYATNHQSWLAEAMLYELKNLKMGLRLADADELAELRHNNDDDTWGAPEGSPQNLYWPGVKAPVSG